MAGKLLDFDPFTGIAEYHYKEGDKNIIRSVQDIDQNLKLNDIDRNNASSGWKGNFHKVASIPLIVLEQWRNELKAKGADDCNPLSKANRQFFLAKLNDYNYKRLRTKDGAI